MLPTLYRHLADFRNANKATGHHFFAPDTLRFFNSRVDGSLYGGLFFVTSEKGPWEGAQRLFTVRAAQADGGCSTVGEFQEYRTLASARAAAKALAKSLGTLDPTAGSVR